MHISADLLMQWVAMYLWPFARIGAFIGTIPVTGSPMVPMRIRLILALGITILVAPLIQPVTDVNPLSLMSALILFQQVMIGIAMGFVLRMVFGTFIHGGQIIAMQMGLGFASVVDPQNGVQVPVISQIFLILVTLIFITMDGHLIWIAVLVDSFHVLPLTGGGLANNALWTLMSWGSQMFAWALLISLPAVASLLVANLAFGVVARAAPQLNIFSVGFPVTMTLGFFVILITISGVLPQFNSIFAESLSLARLIMMPGSS